MEKALRESRQHFQILQIQNQALYHWITMTTWKPTEVGQGTFPVLMAIIETI